MVFSTTGFINSALGIIGSGFAVSDQSADDFEKKSSPSQMLCRRYLG